MALSFVEHQGDGVTATFSVPFPYLSQDHVKVIVDGVARPFTWNSPSVVRLGVAPPPQSAVQVRRETPNTERMVDFENDSILDENLLDQMNLQLFYIAQETLDASARSASSTREQVTSIQAKVDSAVVQAAGADSTATRAAGVAAAAKTVADQALARSDAASTQAARAVTTANTATEAIAGATEKAAAAHVLASGIDAKATQALATAKGIDGKASQALDNATEALRLSSSASTTANGIAGTANAALAAASTAEAKSDAATSTANGIAGTANAANTTARAAETKADAAVATADAANGTAGTAKATAEQAKATADGIANTASSALATAGQASAVANELRRWAVANPGAADASTDLDTLGATAETAGKFPYLVGGPAGGRNNGHPDGQTVPTAANGACNHYWIETWRYSAENRYQEATPAAGAANVRSRYRMRSAAGWTPWMDVGKVPADAALATAQAAIAALKADMDAGFRAPKPSWMMPCGQNTAMALVEGVLYAACGDAAYTWNYGVARGGTGMTARYGVDDMQRIPVPGRVASAGGNGVNNWALNTLGELYVWGQNGAGTLGLGHQSPVGVPTLSATGIAEVFDSGSCAGINTQYNRLFARRTDGVIVGAGFNTYGALGVGDTTHRTAWTVIPISNVETLWNLGTEFGCTFVKTTTGRLLVAGYNGYGQLGTGNTTNATSWVDVTAAWGGSVAGLTSIQGAFGYYDTGHSSASSVMMVNAGVVRTCGNNNWGQLGNGTNTAASTPFAVPGLTAKEALMTGGGPASVFVLATDGKLYAWGHNGRGQLGLGAGAAAWLNVPTVISSLSGAPGSPVVDKILNGNVDRPTYGYNACTFFRVPNADGTSSVYGVGPNGYGDRGIGHSADALVPARVLLPTHEVDGSPLVVEQIVAMGSSSAATGAYIYIARTAAGRLWAWGCNYNYGIHAANGVSSVVVPLNLRTPWRREER